MFAALGWVWLAANQRAGPGLGAHCGGFGLSSPPTALCLYSNKAFWHKCCMGPRRDLEMPVGRNARTVTLWNLEYVPDCVEGRSLKTGMLNRGS